MLETDSIIPESTQVVTIADREADFYDLFACPRRQGADFLIRATQNRCLVGSDDHLWETMESVTPQGTMMVEIKRNPNHYVLKSGCQIEKLQLKTAQRLEMALATYSIVAWRLLWLTYMARRDPDSSCEEVFATYEWQSLYATIHKQIYTDDTPPTLAQVIGWIARLGGFLGRKCDGFPGVKVLWRGLRRLNDIAQTWLLCQSLSSYTS